MTATTRTARGTAAADVWPGRLWLLIPGVLSLAPYVAYHRMFARLFWFGDEIDLIDQIDRLGFWKWTLTAFAENFVPLFKVLWGGEVFLFGGSYAAMIAVTWFTHALNVVLLGRLMRTCGASWGAALAAQVGFGLASSNWETLAWSVQWSAMLAATFMLLALEGFFRRPSAQAPVALAAASALSFSRGVLTGALLAGASLATSKLEPALSPRRRLALAASYLLPAALVGFVIFAAVPSSNLGHMDGHWGNAALFGAWYYLINPAHYLLRIGSFAPKTVIAMGVLKVALTAWSIARTEGRLRTLFVVLVAFDLGNAVLLGIGRYHTGLVLAASSRYQYASLIACMPVAAFWFTRQWERLPAPASARGAILCLLLAAVSAGLCLQWPAELDPETTSRGTQARHVLLGQEGDSQAVPGYPGFSVSRARELVAKYNLH
jgi:hypothetical protein